MLSGDAYDWHRHYLSKACQIDDISQTSLLCCKCRSTLERIKHEDESAMSTEVDIGMLTDEDEKSHPENSHPESEPASNSGVTLNV